MQRVRRETEGDNVVLLAVCLKGVQQVTLMAIQDKHPPDTSSLLVCVFMEVLDPFHTRVIICPAIW